MKTSEICPVCKAEIDVSSFNDECCAYLRCAQCNTTLMIKITMLLTLTRKEIITKCIQYGKDIETLVDRFNKERQPQKDIGRVVNGTLFTIEQLNEFLSHLYEMEDIG